MANSMVQSTTPSVKSSYWSVITNNSKAIKLFLLIAAGLIFWSYPHPQEVSSQAWHLLTIFIFTIIAMVSKILPTGSLAIITVSLCCSTSTLPVEKAIIGFSSKIIWLVFSAFILARGFTKTGLGARIAYYFVYLFGKNTVGLSYGLILTELFLSPLIPSNTARGAGIMFPIANAISKEYNSKTLGGLLMKICFHANVITSAMFMTASAANPLITSISKNFGYELNWLVWAKTAIVPGLLSLFILPFLLFLFFPGALKNTSEIQQFAKQQIDNSGPLKQGEWVMLGTFFLLLFLWVAGSYLGIDATASAFIGLSILLISNVLTWNDVIAEKEAWSTFMWLATLLMLATNLSQLGIISWMSTQIHASITGYSWQAGLLLLATICFFAHYLLASFASHISALYAAFCSIVILLGAPAPIAVLVFAGVSNFSGAVTHYSTGAAPLFFSSNYISMQKWWQIGLVVGLVNATIWLLVGGWWWKLLHLW